jgi:hypothetical protein
MSELLGIYARIAQTPITFLGGDNGPVSVYATALDDTPNTMESAELPARLLQPFGGRGEGRLESYYTSANGVIVVDWNIADMLFWRAAASGIGLADVSADLVRYKVAYVSAIKALRTNKWSVTSMVLMVESFEWPARSERSYHGVIARLTVREIVP